MRYISPFRSFKTLLGLYNHSSPMEAFHKIRAGDLVSAEATNGRWKRALVMTDPVRDYKNVLLVKVFLIDDAVEPEEFLDVKQSIRPCPEDLLPSVFHQRAIKVRRFISIMEISQNALVCSF
jgi:hypothetical protein